MVSHQHLSTAELLKLSPDELLSTYTVAEATAVAKQLQREVDRKREELRVMVGERYRDLIEAADTIQNMKESSLSVIEVTSGMESSCFSLQKRACLDSRPMDQHAAAGSVSPVNEPYLSVAGSVQLLMSIPEYVWAAVESRRLIRASQLFLLARHVNTSLQVDAGTSLTAERISESFPVVSRHWASVQNFQATILGTCRAQLLEPALTPEAAADSLAASLLLQGTTARQAFDEFLSLRKAALEAAARDGLNDSAKRSMCRLLTLVITTVQAVHSIFMEGEDAGRLWAALKTVVGKEAAPTLELVDEASLGLVAKHLPGPVKQFKPRLVQKFTAVDRKVVTDAVSSWLDSSQRVVQQMAQSLLVHVNSVSALVSVRSAIYDLLSERLASCDWTNISEATTGKTVQLWQLFYKKAITDRVKELVGEQVRECVGCVREGVARTVEQTDLLDKEADLGWFVWSEATADLNGINWGGSKVSVDLMKNSCGLAMKCWGWSPQVQQLCHAFNTRLKGLRADMSGYTEDDGETAQCEDEAVFDKYSETGHLLTFLCQEMLEQFDRLLTECRESCARQTDSRPGVILLLARLYQALPSLASHLKGCLETLDSKQEPYSATLFHRLRAESLSLLEMWRDRQVGEYTGRLSESAGSADETSSLPAWDKVTIQEVGDTQEVSSDIHVPSSLSIPLGVCLQRLATCLHRSGASSFPPGVLANTSQLVCTSTCTVYRQLAGRKLTQNVALQLAFDLRFVQTLFVSREHKDQMGSEIGSIIDQLETNIDPFDLSVFSSHIAQRVKKAVARAVTSYGCLVPNDRIAIVSNYKVSSGSQQETHNVMCLSSPAGARFQMLPVPRQSRQDTLPVATRAGAQLTVDKKPVKKRDRSPVSTAASFFNSMSTSWFGTN